jgi:hypothetical protein
MANGLLDLLGGALGTTPPAYLQGLLGENAVEDLRKRSIGSGLVNALIGYAAAPKNQNLGLGRILAGAAQSGIEGAQNVYQGATQDYMMQQRIAEAQRKQDQQAKLQTMLGAITDPNDRLLAELNPEAYVSNKLKTVQRKTFVAPDGSIRFEDTGEIANATNVAAPKARPTQIAPNGQLIYTDTGEPVTNRSFAAPKPPREPKEISYKIETGADGNIYYIPTKPNSPILDVSGRPTNTYKPAGAKPTEDQSKAAGWLSQATNAYNNMQKVMFVEGTQIPTGAESPTALEAGLSSIGLEGAANYVRSAPRQQFVQATSSLSEALLRAATGAGVNRDEANQKVKELTPLYTDDPATKQQKLAAIPIYLQSLQIRAGSSGKAVAPQVDKINIIPAGAKMPVVTKRDRDAILKQYNLGGS